MYLHFDSYVRLARYQLPYVNVHLVNSIIMFHGCSLQFLFPETLSFGVVCFVMANLRLLEIHVSTPKILTRVYIPN